jgi:hypothetical protein
MMTRYLLLALFLGAAMAAPHAEDESSLVDNSEARFLYLNSSSTATSLTLLGALILLGVIFYLVYVGGLLSPAASSYSNYSRYGQDYNQYYQNYNGQARSSNEGWGFNAMNVLQWISMLQEVYEKFDYNDVECQKRLICEVLKEEDYFGDVSRNLKSGFELAKYLEVMNLPDEFRELLDEYMDASERSLGQKQCEEFFQCPYSLKDSVKRNFSGNSL